MLSARFLRTEANDGEQAAGAGAFFAVAEEEVAAAGGAKFAGENILFAEARGEKLGAIGFAQIEMHGFGRRLMAGGVHVEPLEGIRLVASARLVEIVRSVGKLRGELSDQFGADFIAAWSDGGTNCSQQIGGAAGEFALHDTDGFLSDASKSAAPTRMNCGNGAFARIDQQDRNAIGGLNGEKQAWVCGGGSIANASGIRRSVKNLDDVGVDLFQGSHAERFGTNGILEGGAIFFHVFARVPVGEAQVQNTLAVQGTGTAFPGAEAVNEPRKFCERRQLKNVEAVFFFDAPGLGKGLRWARSFGARLRRPNLGR